MAEESLRFLRDPDQQSRRQELRLFIGPNADAFLRTYDTLYAQSNPGSPAPAGLSRFGGFSFPALFFGPIWFLYRKMWGWAAAVFGLGIVLGFIPHVGGAGIGLAAGMGAAGRRLYLGHAINRIMQIRARFEQSAGTLPAASSGISASQPSSFAAELARSGGVSRLAAWISGVVVFVLFALVLLGGFVLLHQGR